MPTDYDAPRRSQETSSPPHERHASDHDRGDSRQVQGAAEIRICRLQLCDHQKRRYSAAQTADEIDDKTASSDRDSRVASSFLVPANEIYLSTEDCPA